MGMWNKNVFIMFFVFMSLIIARGQAMAAPLETMAYAVEDTYVYKDNPTFADGSATYVIVGLSDSYRGFVKPDLSSFNGKVITGGKIYVDSYNSTVVYALPYNLNGDWAQSSLTWNNQPSAGSLTGGQIPIGDGASKWSSIDSIARSWNINKYGMVIKSGDVYSSSFYSREYTSISCARFYLFYFNPPGPISLSSPSTPTKISVSWGTNGNPGDAVYSLYRNGGLIYKGTSTTYNDTGLSAGTGYNYMVYTSYDGDGTTYYSSSTSATLYTAPPTPTAPTGTITALAWSATAGRGKVVLNWSPVATATGYKMWVWDGNDYRGFDVGNTLTWDSSAAKIYPDENWLNSQADNSISGDPFNHAGGGFDLRDDPVKLYIKTIGTTYDSSHNYWFRVSAYNAYGESPYGNAYTPTLTNRTDTTIPSGTISVTVPEGATAPATVTVNLSSITDSESGLYQMQFSNDGTSYSAWQAFATAKSWTTSSGEGQKTIYVKVKDNVGNTATFTVNFWLGATLTQIYNEAQAGSQKAEAARLAAEESKINSNAAKTAAEAASTNSGIAAANATTASDRAYYTGRYGGSTESVADVAGYVRNTQLPSMDTKIDNIQTTVNNMASADTLPPAVDLKTVSGAVATSGGSINIIVTVSDNRSATFTYSLDGTTYQALPANGIISVPVGSPGPNVITVRVKDEANNIGSKSITIRKL